MTSTPGPSKPAATPDRLVFVYNVDASPVAMLKDLYQGITTGSTDCNLCDVTFGRLLKDRSWKRFVESLPLEVEFKLRSTFRKEHPEVDAEFPAAFTIAPSGEVAEVISAEQMNRVDDVDELRDLVSSTIDEIVPTGGN